MSLSIIRKALEQRLAALAPAIATAYENAPFVPAVGTPYQRVSMALDSGLLGPVVRAVRLEASSRLVRETNPPTES